MRRTPCNPWPVLGQQAWADTLADVLHLTDGAVVARAAVARCLLAAAALGVAVSAVAKRVAGVGRETIRKAFAADLPADLPTPERHLAAGLRRRFPRSFRKRPIPIAIDTHQRPFYGDRDASGDQITAAQLDACNGITSATPEFPDGIYHYVLLPTSDSTSSIRCL